MGKRRADADTRRFFDEFAKVRISRFRAMGVVDPAKSQAVIPFPNGKSKLIGVTHVHFPNGGGWSLFLCPKCARRTPTLHLIDDRPLCWKCCDAMNIKHATRYGFGRATRRLARDRKLDEVIAKLEATEPLSLNPRPPSWRGSAKRINNSQRLTNSMRRRMISLRLDQLAHDHARNGVRVTARWPAAAAKQLIDLKPIMRARTHEGLQQALDKAQAVIIAALSSDDPQQRLNAAKLMLRTKQARDRGL